MPICTGTESCHIHDVIIIQKINNTGYYEDIKRLFKTVCNCSVDLEHVRVECSSVTGTMLLLGTVTYSDSEGSVTASTLIDKLQVWLLTSTNPVITLQNQSFNLISQCPVRLTSATEGVCSNLRVATSDSVASESATIIGGSFFGGVLTGVLACIVTLCIGFW